MAAAQCLGPLTPSRLPGSSELVLEHDGLRHRYIVYMQLHAQAEQAWATTGGGTAGRNAARHPGRAGGRGDAGAVRPASRRSPARRRDLLPRQADLPGRRDLLPGGVVLAYATGRLLLGIGVLAALAWRNSGLGAGASPNGAALCHGSRGHRCRRATGNNSRRDDGDELPLGPPEDCRSGYAARQVRLGRRHVGDHLPGHRHEVCSLGRQRTSSIRPDSGILAEGRAFFYFLEKPDAKAILDHPLFRVRTPTLIVTDGGGSQFEIDVNKTPSSHMVVLSRPGRRSISGPEGNEDHAGKRVPAGEAVCRTMGSKFF